MDRDFILHGDFQSHDGPPSQLIRNITEEFRAQSPECPTVLLSEALLFLLCHELGGPGPAADFMDDVILRHGIPVIAVNAQERRARIIIPDGWSDEQVNKFQKDADQLIERAILNVEQARAMLDYPEEHQN